MKHSIVSIHLLLWIAIAFIAPLITAQQPTVAPVQVLMIVTSTSELNNQGEKHLTGCWAEELFEPAELFNKAGFLVTIASPKGGEIPFDKASLSADMVGANTAERYQKLLKNPEYRYATPLSKILKNPDFPYEVVFLCGGHGTLADFHNNYEIKQILLQALEHHKILAGVCHGVAGLLNLKGHPLMLDAHVGGFSDAEEQAIGLIPMARQYLLGHTLQGRLTQLVGPNGKYECGGLWQGHIVNYQNRLITGQNPMASIPLAQEIIRVVQSLSRNPVKSAMQKNYPVFGPFVTIGHPSVAEILCYNQIDFLWIEGEHSALALPQILSLNIAANQSKTASIVRVPTNNPDTIKQYVDTGVSGIIIPAIKNVSDTKKAVRSLKYPPVGERGIGLGRSTGYFVHLKDYLANANQDVLVICMIETAEAVEDISAIVQVEGLDLLIIGPFDLSASLGLPGQVTDPKVQEAIAKVEKVAKTAGIPLGISVPDHPTAMKFMDRGYRFFVIGSDIEYLTQGVNKFFASAESIPIDQPVIEGIERKPVIIEEIDETSPIVTCPDLNWKIDDNIKYHYGYMEPEWFHKQVEPDIESILWLIPATVPFSTPNKPDITNIKLDGILNLGFPLPTRSVPQDYNFYLKFYHYPSCLNPAASAEKIIASYLLDQMQGIEILRNYMSRREKIYIKHGVIAESNRVFNETTPFPSLKLPASPIQYKQIGKIKVQTFDVNPPTLIQNNITPQSLFDSSLPFVSLYLQPTTPEPSNASSAELANWSAQGMLAFYRELLELYRKHLIELDINDPKMYYFVQPSYSVENQKTLIVVWRIPKEPMIFANFRSLPMPHDPEHIFLSSLLLVYREQYIGENNLDALQHVIGSPDFQQVYEPAGAQVLEVGSVVVVK